MLPSGIRSSRPRSLIKQVVAASRPTKAMRSISGSMIRSTSKTVVSSDVSTTSSQICPICRAVKPLVVTKLKTFSGSTANLARTSGSLISTRPAGLSGISNTLSPAARDRVLLISRPAPACGRPSSSGSSLSKPKRDPSFASSAISTVCGSLLLPRIFRRAPATSGCPRNKCRTSTSRLFRFASLVTDSPHRSGPARMLRRLPSPSKISAASSRDVLPELLVPTNRFTRDSRSTFKSARSRNPVTCSEVSMRPAWCLRTHPRVQPSRPPLTCCTAPPPAASPASHTSAAAPGPSCAGRRRS